MTLPATPVASNSNEQHCLKQARLLAKGLFLTAPIRSGCSILPIRTTSSRIHYHRPRRSVRPTSAEMLAPYPPSSSRPETLALTSPQENQALAGTLRAYPGAPSTGRPVSPSRLFGTISQLPWKASLLVNMGLSWRRAGFFSRAIDAWTRRHGISANDKRRPGAGPWPIGRFRNWSRFTPGWALTRKLQPLLEEVKNRTWWIAPPDGSRRPARTVGGYQYRPAELQVRPLCRCGSSWVIPGNQPRGETA